MIRVIGPECVDQFEDEIASMHRLRYRVFKERLGWDLSAKNGVERDEYDDCDPTYLVSCNGPTVIGGWRLLPTTGRFMLGEVFEALLEGETLLGDPTIWEASRLAVDFDRQSGLTLGQISRCTHELICGVVEFGLAYGINDYLAVYDRRIGRWLRRVGQYPVWQSEWHRIGRSDAAAARFKISESVLEQTRAMAGIAEPVLDWSVPRVAA